MKTLVTGIGRLHRRLPGRGAARRRATKSSGSTTTPSTGRSSGPSTRTRSYRGVEGDAKDVGLLKELLADCDHFVAGAAIIGGISLFHELAYDLISENERITAAAFDAAIWRTRHARLQEDHRRLVVDGLREHDRPTRPPRASSGGARRRSRPTASRSWPPSTSPRGRTSSTSSPTRSSGHSTALAWARSAPCRTSEIISGNVKLAMSHVVPDLVQKVLKGQDPLHILGDGSQVRHYTYGGDLARGIRLAIESPAARTRTSTSRPPTRRPSSSWPRLIWQKVNGDEPFRFVSDKPYTYDVQKRVPVGREGQATPRFRGDDVPVGVARRDHPLDRESDRDRAASDGGNRTAI